MKRTKWIYIELFGRRESEFKILTLGKYKGYFTADQPAVRTGKYRRGFFPFSLVALAQNRPMLVDILKIAIRHLHEICTRVASRVPCFIKFLHIRATSEPFRNYVANPLLLFNVIRADIKLAEPCTKPKRRLYWEGAIQIGTPYAHGPMYWAYGFSWWVLLRWGISVVHSYRMGTSPN